MSKTQRHLLPRLALASFITLLTLLAAEFGYRALLFSDFEAFERLRDPSKFSDYFSSNDYWKLTYAFGGEPQPPATPHPTLGWVGWFARDTYLHDAAGGVGDRRPVLLYGDSFAATAANARSFEEILNADAEFSRDHHLLNYGVGGYGLDQILLLFQNSVDRFERPFVVFSLMTLDLDRSVLSVRTGQKPRFRVDDNRLVYPSKPIDADPARFFAEHPPEITSYLLRRLAHSSMWSDGVSSWLRGQRTIRQEKITLNALLLAEAVRELRRRKLDFVFLVFHPHWPGVATLEEENWRDEFLLDTLRRLEVPHILSKDLLDDGQLERAFSGELYTDDGHPTTEFNEIIAAAIRRAVLDSPHRKKRAT